MGPGRPEVAAGAAEPGALGRDPAAGREAGAEPGTDLAAGAPPRGGESTTGARGASVPALPPGATGRAGRDGAAGTVSPRDGAGAGAG
jgi:hypothetical protein